MVRIALVTGALALFAACIRPTSNYDVQIYADGTELGDVLPEPVPMGGMIEVVRYRLWGTNLGHGQAQLFSDQPRRDGEGFVFGTASFGYPKDPAFDRYSTMLMAGPEAGPTEDACVTRIVGTRFLAFSEYVDVGDRILIASGDTRIELPRDPASYPDPAGEAFFVGYGDRLLAHRVGGENSTWKSSATLELSFPGAVQPSTATFGAVPYPVADFMRFPDDIVDLEVDGRPVRAPHHGYDDAGVAVPGYLDDVRFPGPWTAPLPITWTPSESGDPLTVTVRLIGLGSEDACTDCSDCGDGFTCDFGYCTGDEGSGWAALGEVTCTVADDGAFDLRPALLEELRAYIPVRSAGGALLLVSRIAAGTIDVPDALTSNGRAAPLSPVRTRASDIIVTRLELP